MNAHAGAGRIRGMEWTEKGEGFICTTCGKEATEDHMKSDAHKRRGGYPWSMMPKDFDDYLSEWEGDWEPESRAKWRTDEVEK